MRQQLGGSTAAATPSTLCARLHVAVALVARRLDYRMRLICILAVCFIAVGMSSGK